MFEGSELKVQLTTGCVLHKNIKCLLLITFAPSMEHVFNYYIVEKLTIPIVLGMQWL